MNQSNSFLKEKSSIRVLFYINNVLFFRAIIPPHDYDVRVTPHEEYPIINLDYAPVISHFNKY